MLSLASTIQHPPNIQVDHIVDDILGSTYSLTIVYIGRKRAQSLNQKYRQKSYIPNVLSFPLTDQCGEIYICPEIAALEAKKRAFTTAGYITYLIIHGALHLVGYKHGQVMDTEETKYLRRYNIT